MRGVGCVGLAMLLVGCYESHDLEGRVPFDAGRIVPLPRDAGADAGRPMLGARLVQVTTGGNFTCSLASDGRAFCWGDNGQGQLGDGLRGREATRFTPAPVQGLAPADEITNGSSFTCARLQGGQVMCWGSNTNVNLGDGTDVDHELPEPVRGLPGPAERVNAGDFHACAIVSGEVWCWGRMANGVLGDGETIRAPLPVRAIGIDDAIDIDGGPLSACALRGTGEVWCWGNGDSGALGTGTDDDQPIPVPVRGITDAVDVDVGDRYACAALASGRVTCWGTNTNGQLGDGNRRTESFVPVMTRGIDDAIAVSAAINNTCALRASGEVLCWGFGGSGRLGAGPMDLEESVLPIPVVGLTDAIQIDASVSGHVCALRRAGVVVCWGNGINGPLGHDVFSSDVPLEVPPHGG